MENLLKWLAGRVSIAMFISLAEQELLKLARSQGAETAIERVIKLPQADVEKLCAVSGADVTEAVALRDTAAKAEADFLVYVATGATPA